MVDIPANAVIPGLVERLGIEQEVPLPKASGTVITKGQVIAPDTNGLYIPTPADASSRGPYAVAVKAAGSGTVTVAAVTVGSIVSVVADGAIKPRKYVMPSASTAGQVIAYTAPILEADIAIVDTKVGIYLKHVKSVNEGDGATIPTAAADGDIIYILLV